LALARFIGVELRYSDIDHFNQPSRSHQSNAPPVFVKFVSRWMRDEFYSWYLHCVKRKSLTVTMLFRLYEDDNRRIYVSEHLTLHDSTIFREAKRLKRMNLFSRVFTVSLILLNGDERISRDAGDLPYRCSTINAKLQYIALVIAAHCFLSKMWHWTNSKI
jgi:hypothetical protein